MNAIELVRRLNRNTRVVRHDTGTPAVALRFYTVDSSIVEIEVNGKSIGRLLLVEQEEDEVVGMEPKDDAPYGVARAVFAVLEDG